MSHQYRLFEYTKANDLLIGEDVVEADIIKRKIKALQKQKILVENWRLDIHFRDPIIVDTLIVMKLERGGALTEKERYAIAIPIKPASISSYNIPIAFFEYKEDAEALLETIQDYITLRYGV